MATKVLDETREFDNGARYDLRPWQVPKSAEFPEGLKYSLQYVEPNGTPRLRYDNYHPDPDLGRHHRHTPTEDTSIEYEGLRAHVRRFQQEVYEIRHAD
ncbi:toxin-antitoxin system TumE family protein [Halegenticoccus tardaugens]|uniref:toxin-antitoxin system TumE family protein n=1 Tax=Halegenticoccus tardaugens TaxID=2071624 RepID=UPI00100B68A9|nr:DUF6516 family protein [Halegenticoccus tardaugens]